MSPLTIVAKVVAKKDSIAAVRAELLKLVAPTRNEDGCIEYRLHQDRADPAVFIFYENWENGDSLARHMESEHFRNYVSAVSGMIEDKTVHRMSLIG